MSERDDSLEVYGKLKEGLHIATYSFERASSHLEWMLESDRWKLGDVFDNVNTFLDSLRLDQLRSTIEQRKRIAKRIKELQPDVSNRQIGRTLGVDHRTVDRDLGANSPPANEKPNKNNEPSGAVGENSPPPEFSGASAAKHCIRHATAKEDRLAKVAADEQRVLALRPIAGKFRTIVIDPAWAYDHSGPNGVAGRAMPGYAEQTFEQLWQLDVRAWADEQVGCHLYVCTTNAFMPRACELRAHWGFEHQTIITWIKPPPFGLGNFFRNSTEHIIFATLGETTTRPAASSIPTHFEASRGEHSEKPERFYEIVRAASYPPYGEANQRKPRPDFTNLFDSSWRRRSKHNDAALYS